jgi:small conductance mechanosensitive channel
MSWMRRFLCLACLLAPLMTAPVDVRAQEAAVVQHVQDVVSSIPPEATTSTIDEKTLGLILVALTERDLAEVAEAWREIIKSHVLRMARLRLEMDAADTERRAALRGDFIKLQEDRAALSANFRTVVNAWEDKGAPADEVAQFRRYHRAVLVEGAAYTDTLSSFDRLLQWLGDPKGAIADGLRLAVFMALAFGLAILARVTRGVSQRRLDRIRGLSGLLRDKLAAASYWVVLCAGIVFLLARYGVNLTPILALLGGASFILAFAMQDALGNLASGVMILLTRPFDVGDYVTVGGVGGTVKSLGVAATTIATPDNQAIMIPNNQVWGSAIVNATGYSTRRLDLVFDVSYDSDLAMVLAILRNVVETNPMSLADPRPSIEVGELGDNSVKILCRPWVRTPDYWRLRWDLMAAVKARFDEEGIAIPFPQMDVHVEPSNHPISGVQPAATDAATR